MDRVEFFQGLGFGEYESKVLASLARLGKANVKEISLDSGVPQNKLYGILKNFENESLLAQIPHDTKKYELINLKTFINERLKVQEARIRNLKKCSKDFAKIKEKDEQFVFSLIKGQRAIMNRIAEMNLQVRNEIFGVQRNWKVWGEGLRQMQNAVKRGVSVKMIGIVNEGTKKRVEEWKKTGIKIRKYNKKFGEYPLRFSVFDNRFARITIGKPEVKDSKNYITIWTDSKPLVQMLRNQFMQMWKECERY